MFIMSDALLFPAIPDFPRRAAKYGPISAALRDAYGYPGWRPYLAPLDELIDCILSQSTTDRNRDRAFSALKERFPTWEDVMNAPTRDVIDTIRPAGLANQKGPRIQEVLRRIQAECGALDIEFLGDLPVDEAKAWLTRLDGVGPKTAAIVLCFAFNRPAFPVDTHIHRLGQRIGFLPAGITADKAHAVMEAIVPPDDYYAFHLNLIRHGREVCHARKPDCARCPLQANCDYFQQLVRKGDDGD
jgi:endonuclease-3